MAAIDRLAYRYLLRKAQSRTAAVDGLPRRKVVDLVNKAIQKANIDGIHRDTAWVPIQRIWKALEVAGIPFGITGSEYQKDRETGNPISKTWKFEIDFTNERGRPTTVYGVVVASGAGSIKDPLDAYDVVAYAS